MVSRSLTTQCYRQSLHVLPDSTRFYPEQIPARAVAKRPEHRSNRPFCTACLIPRQFFLTVETIHIWALPQGKCSKLTVLCQVETHFTKPELKRSRMPHATTKSWMDFEPDLLQVVAPSWISGAMGIVVVATYRGKREWSKQKTEDT